MTWAAICDDCGQEFHVKRKKLAISAAEEHENLRGHNTRVAPVGP